MTASARAAESCTDVACTFWLLVYTLRLPPPASTPPPPTQSPPGLRLAAPAAPAAPAASASRRSALYWAITAAAPSRSRSVGAR